MRNVTLGFVVFSLVTYLIVFAPVGISGIFFLFPFTMIPFLVTASLALRWSTIVGQGILLVAAFAYTAWFAFVYVDAMYWHPDPQSGIAFLFVGLYAAPFLLLLWLVGFGLEFCLRRAKQTR